MPTKGKNFCHASETGRHHPSPRNRSWCEWCSAELCPIHGHAQPCRGRPNASCAGSPATTGGTPDAE